MSLYLLKKWTHVKCKRKKKRIVSNKKYMVKLYNELNTSKYPREIVVLLLKSLFLSLG